GSSGSSAGPSSATAAGCVAFGIGTETSGSIVSPARECGLSALRPTFGRVSRYGGMVLAWSQDRVGPITRTVEDAAMVFNAIHGVDEKDPSTVTTPFKFDPNIKLASLRVGVDPNAPKEFVDKPKEIGLDLNTVVAPPTNNTPYPGTSPTATAGTPMAPADWNPRFVTGRTVKAYEFLQQQRRRYVLVQKWGEFMKDLDMFIGAP